VPSVFGEVGESETVAVGSAFATETESVAAAPSTVPSFGVTSTPIVSPASPWPGCERSSVGPVAPATTAPFTVQT